MRNFEVHVVGKKLKLPSINVEDSAIQKAVGKGVQEAGKVGKKRLEKRAVAKKRARRRNIGAGEEEIKKREAVNKAIRERQKEKLKQKPNFRERLLKKRSQARHEGMDARQRFGARTYLGEDAVFFEEWNIATIEEELENLKKQIEIKVQEKIANKKNYFFIEKLSKYKEKLKDDKEFIQLCENYEFLKKERDKIQNAIKARTEWERWNSGSLPKESAKKRILKHTETAIGIVGGSLPVIGPMVSAGYKFYRQMKDFAVDILDNTINIASGTRRLSSGGRIASSVVGAVTGAVIVGGVFALISALVPFLGIGVAAAGTAGIFAGAVIGWNTGAQLGLGLFNWLAGRSSRLRAEADYQMEYRHLRLLRKLYGFDEAIVLKMYSYLSNQINLLGENGGEALEKLRTAALEEGREASLARLCIYFISQEKMLRSVFYNLSKESIVNQKERVDLLKEKMRLLEEEAPKEELEKLEEKLRENHEKMLSIANKRSEIIRERNGILEILKEFKDPSEFYGKKESKNGPIHVYNNMCLIDQKTGSRLVEKDAIEKLFYLKSDLVRLEIDPDDIDESNMWPEEAVLSRDIRSFGEETKEGLAARKEFMKEMKAHGLEYLQKQAKQTELKTVELSDFDQEIRRHFQACVEESNRILGFLRLDEPHGLIQLNQDLANNIFELRKVLQIIRDESFHPEDVKKLERNIQQLEDVQFFLQILNRKNARVPDDSPIRDLIGDRRSLLSKDEVRKANKKLEEHKRFVDEQAEQAEQAKKHTTHQPQKPRPWE